MGFFVHIAASGARCTGCAFLGKPDRTQLSAPMRCRLFDVDLQSRPAAATSPHTVDPLRAIECSKMESAGNKAFEQAVHAAISKRPTF